MARETRIEETKIEKKAQRRRRDVTGAERGLKLHVPEEYKDKDFTYRFVNDRPGRIRNLTEMDDYEVVSDVRLGATDGTIVNRVADTYTGEKTVLLRKPKEFYEADKAAEQAIIEKNDEKLRVATAPEGQDGKNFYNPKGRNIIGGK